MPADDLALLTEAALAAGAIARRHFGGDVAVTQKPGGQGPVTEADLEIDAMLRERLTAARPGYGWLSEEGEDDPGRQAARRTFIIDPIDGTRAFIEGHRDFTHALAVVEDGRPVAAAVHQPMRDRTWTAAQGQGAALDGAPIAPSDGGTIAAATILGAKANFDPSHWGGPLEARRAYRSSLAYRLCLVAQGRFDAMVTLRWAWEWDIAAGALICAEAGAGVSDRHGKPLRFNNAHPQVDGVIAAAPALHAALLDRRAAAG